MRVTYQTGTRRWLLEHPAAVPVLSRLAAGCSSSKPAYCTDATNLKTSVSNLGNVDVAKNGLGSLQTALNSVQTNANMFATDAKSAYPPRNNHRAAKLGVQPGHRDEVRERPASRGRGRGGRPGQDLGEQSGQRRLRQMLVNSARQVNPGDRHGQGRAVLGINLAPGHAMPGSRRSRAGDIRKERADAETAGAG